jgi:hypothetical protein
VIKVRIQRQEDDPGLAKTAPNVITSAPIKGNEIKVYYSDQSDVLEGGRRGHMPRDIGNVLVSYALL